MGGRANGATACLLLALCASGCEALAPRIVPIQSSRTLQPETFRQRFRGESVPSVERLFQKVLGPGNYDALTADEWNPYVEAVMDDRVAAMGTVTLSISLYPADHEQVFFTGWGNYVVFERPTGEALATGIFELVDDGPIPTIDLRARTLRTRIRQWVRRLVKPERTAYVHESEASLNVHLKKVDEDLFMIDYSVGHEVGIEGRDGKVVVMACLELADRGDGRKVIDLRGLDLVRNDYGERLGRAGYEEASRRAVPEWTRLRQCPADGSRASDCYCGRKQSHGRMPKSPPDARVRDR